MGRSLALTRTNTAETGCAPVDQAVPVRIARELVGRAASHMR